ncbi:MAG: asparagine synthase (glutamine-hydrolyzing) [Candidatus Portnoybacteria bacterium RIFCSPLOWO2_01_FULL_43_11]|uniref:asparagine synthase (glutamine-hydrolyzing) n=3 Tax=Candidatus Portnoyibacteriota TaxID=1817913 RepID=A0A1G2FS08_9BACT|nr:MAG: asparagine synthase (glutamine-hydrolyzing) [Candidatus Portnoybacteria bacterium RIFCSPHIGHO2_12_FULL_40_11]OGZ38433.1 MAG: asparagine synthase (glutamine-hydrolyzing) [Candidatus Portnoybacteria bacterium RIFCSPLOWO2_01_FULL_43_11]OGZ40813.1 MAG: asparagine synthase (glutamine-hydrolyzing) [Candidatus Portnoybacteria bacterium RIFCSPLOWO2_02_FULL_40_15]
MCGLAGFLGQGNREILGKMTSAVKHRGPDDEGFYNFENLYLGHRRLSIIDLSLGHQPLSNEDKTVWIIFNGEIYNFLELRKGLEKKGHKFKTQTDTEVIVHLYEEEGESFLNKLNGMFALALWDQKEKKIILARDRLGQKPLYYSLVNNTLVFGSELKVLLEHPLIKREIDLDELNKYLIYEYAPAPKTIIKGVKKLEPGQFLIFENNQIKLSKYWEIKFSQLENTKNYLIEFENLLEDSVKKRLIADVPLGVFLSGGLDSSTIAYFAQKNSSAKIKTFSIGFTDKSFDESIHAKEVAKFLKTEHYHQTFTPNDLLSLIDDVSEINDEPFADASVIPTYLLSKFTRERVKVALAGDGGDELLAGYPTFQALKFAKLFRKFPQLLRKIIQGMVDYLPVSFNNFSFDFRVKRILSGYDFSPEIQNQIWLGSFLPKENQKLFSKETVSQIDFNESFLITQKLIEEVKKEPLENRLIYLYLKQYLADDILVKADRASMFASLEVRAPFLDYRLVEFINSLPYHLKLKGFKTKYILKRLMKNKLPENIINRPKKGFGLPIAKWLTNELKDFAFDLLSEKKIKEQGIFNYSEIKKLLDEHVNKKADHRKKIWTLLMFQEWYRRWYKQRALIPK